jgi:hypothetical protein
LSEGPRIAAALVNDIGPVIDERGLERIRSYVGRSQSWPTWLHAARHFAQAQRDVYPGWTLEQWLVFAKRLCKLGSNGRIVFDYDMRIAEPFRIPGGATGFDLERAFAGLAGRPSLIVRGELSDCSPPRRWHGCRPAIRTWRPSPCPASATPRRWTSPRRSPRRKGCSPACAEGAKRGVAGWGVMGDVRHNEERGWYELKVGRDTAIAAYRREGDVLRFTHTEVPEALEGQGRGKPIGRRCVGRRAPQRPEDGPALLLRAPLCGHASGNAGPARLLLIVIRRKSGIQDRMRGE